MTSPVISQGNQTTRPLREIGAVVSRLQNLAKACDKECCEFLDSVGSVLECQPPTGQTDKCQSAEESRCDLARVLDSVCEQLEVVRDRLANAKDRCQL